MKKYNNIIFILVSIVLASCVGSLSSITPIPDSNSKQAKIYSERCGTCHSLPHPKRLSYTAWKIFLPVMEQRMSEKGMGKLNEEDKKLILSYLKTHSRK